MNTVEEQYDEEDEKTVLEVRDHPGRSAQSGVSSRPRVSDRKSFAYHVSFTVYCHVPRQETIEAPEVADEMDMTIRISTSKELERLRERHALLLARNAAAPDVRPCPACSFACT